MVEVILVAIALLAVLTSVYFWRVQQREAKAAASVVPVKPSAAESAPAAPAPKDDLPKIAYDEEDAADLELTALGKAVSSGFKAQKIVYDDDAAIDEPTHSGALILVTATGQSHPGKRRKNNEDSLLADVQNGIFVVADGMGGYTGGEVASQLAITTIERAFASGSFAGGSDEAIPRRASELASAIQMANEAVLERAGTEKQLQGMGTTICAARFSPNKQRVYVGHVGDSRAYCLRDGALQQMTSDHTMGSLGLKGAEAHHLSRAVGVWPAVPIDIVLGKPRPGDVYLLCSDGLTKMVDDARIQEILVAAADPNAAVERLIEAANEAGGKDNVTVIVVRVDEPSKSDRPRVAA